MQKNTKEKLFLLFPILLSGFVVLQLLITYIIHIDKGAEFWFNTAWSYLETSVVALMLSLCNSVPYLYRIVKLRNTSSFARYTVFSKLATGFSGLFNITASCVLEMLLFYSDIDWWKTSYIYNNGQGVSYASSLAVMWVRWSTDILGNIVGWTSAIIAVVFKVKNLKNKDEHLKVNWKNYKFVLISAIMAAISVFAICVALYFKLIKHTGKYKDHADFRNVLFWITTVMSCFSAFSAMPTIIKLFNTRNTYSISLFSKVSLLSSMFIWTILDAQTATGFNNFFPVLVSDGITIFWTLIYIVIKILNLRLAKKLNVSEKELCEKNLFIYNLKITNKAKIYWWWQTKKITEELQNGKCLIARTDTVLGIMSLKNETIYEIKERPLEKKVGCFIDHPQDIPNLPEELLPLLYKCWPGKISIIYHDVSYRIPRFFPLLKLLEKTNKLYQSSANISGKETASTINEAIYIFSDKLDKLIFVIGNPPKNSKASTIISLDEKKIIRTGQIDGSRVLDEYIKIVNK